MTITPEFMVQRWTDPKSRPLFKGSLIDETGCKCAQGDVLACSGWTDEQLRAMTQDSADSEVAKILGISRAHAVLLRQVNDAKDGCPQEVLSNPEKVLGDQADKVLSFWLRLDGLTSEQWDAAGAAARDAAWDAAWDAARAAAGAAARDAAWYAARDAAWDAAWGAARDAAWSAAWSAAGDAARAAAGAANEIQGAAIMREKGLPFFFLPMFGIDDPAILARIGGAK
jgi:hypothetical protein